MAILQRRFDLLSYFYHQYLFARQKTGNDQTETGVTKST